jgi:hypothetical protein
MCNPNPVITFAASGNDGSGNARSFTVPFQFDDHDQILGNSAVREPTFERLVGWGRTRVIPFASLALNYRVGGEDVGGYHAVNLAVHLLNCLLVFRLALVLCATPRLRDAAIGERRLLLAGAASFVFACHPIQVQAVTYIVQRVTSLAATFFLGAVLSYVTARLRQEADGRGTEAALGLTYLFAVLALFSKENTITLPLVLVSVEAAFFTSVCVRRVLFGILPIVLILGSVPLVWFFLWNAPSRAPIAAQPDPLLRLLYAAAPEGDVSPLAYLLTQCTVVPRYLALVFLPWGFNVDHDVAIAAGPSAAVVAGGAFLAGLFAAGLAALRRLPLVGFGVLWFFLTIAVESSLLPISDPMVEHRMYLPMVGVALVLAMGLVRAEARFPRVVRAVAPAAGAALVVLTLLRNEVWQSELSLWRDARDKSPGKSRVHLNVGAVLHRAGDWEAAIPYYCEAIRLDPKSLPAQRNLDIALQERLDHMLEEDGEIDLHAGNAEVEVRIGTGGGVMLFAGNPCR